MVTRWEGSMEVRVEKKLAQNISKDQMSPGEKN
jgi:hypothetical protein